MTIASELTKLNTNLTNSYTAVSGKGGTLPQAQNFDNLATAIDSIPSGTTPVITSLNVTPTTSAQTITAPSGTDGYSPVNVSAVTSSIDSNITAGNIKKDVKILGVTGTYEGSGGIGIPREIKNGKYQPPSTSFTFSLPNNVTDIAAFSLAYAFYNCTGLTSVNFPALSNISGNQAFSQAFAGCTGLTSVSFPVLTTISGAQALDYAFLECTGITSVSFSSLATISGGMSYAFSKCRGITSVSFPSLTTVSGAGALRGIFETCTGLTSISFPVLTTATGGSSFNYICRGCTKLTSVSFPELTTASGYGEFDYAFSNCTKLATISFPKLSTISGNNVFNYAFYNCTGLTDIYFRALTTSSFGSLKSQFNNMMNRTGSTNTHTIHFPSNLSSKISTLSGYPLFGGSSNKVVCAFDLPSTQ